MAIHCKKTAGFISAYKKLKRKDPIIVDSMIKNIAKGYDYDVGFFKNTPRIRKMKFKYNNKKYYITYRIITARREILLMDVRRLNRNSIIFYK